MTTEKFKLSCFTLLVVLLFSIAGCSSSGGGDSTNTTGGADTNLGVEIGIVNGYHAVKSTSYDEFDNVISTRVYEVDYDRRIMEVTTNSEANDALGIPENQYTSIAFLDEFGRLERWSDDSYTSYYEFNEQGLLARFHDGNPATQESVFNYDSDGRLQTRTRTFNTDGIVTETQNYRYEYDSRGFLSSGSIISTTEPVLGATAETETSTMNYTVDDLGRITRREKITSYDTSDFGPYTETDNYEYDSNGNVVGTMYSSDGSFIQRRVFEYEESSKPVYNRFLRIFRYFP